MVVDGTCPLPVDRARLVLVPQGAEFQAVRRGLRSDQNLIAIPAGIEPVSKFLDKFWSESSQVYSKIIVMGLCGSLSADLQVGDTVIYQTCQSFEQQTWQCRKIELVTAKLVNGLTSDRVICKSVEKQMLHRSTGCDVVDMEGTAILRFFQPLGIPVTMVRVVSDDLMGDLPDISSAIDDSGQLQPLLLAVKMLQRPRAAIRLIHGSLQGLKCLGQVAAELQLSE